MIRRPDDAGWHVSAGTTIRLNLDDAEGVEMAVDRLSNRQRVLVADDNPDLRQLWRAYLTLSGFDVSEAANGAEAIAKAVQELPAVILMDFSMPRMDGAAAARALKADPRTAAIPVIGLTGYGTAASAHDFHAVCETVLEKPLQPEAVVEALRRLAPRD